ncbi:MAG: FecCD family ABC transporter permease [Candidatus Limnocylindria bacterium]
MIVAGAEASSGRAWRAPVVPTLLLLAFGLAGATVLAVGIGAVAIPPDRLVSVLTGSGDPRDAAILLSIRLPRVLGAALVGASLAVAGALLQGILRNPLADPYVLGTSAGASVGAVIGFTLAGAFGFLVIPSLAFVGAIVAVFIVWNLARTTAGTPVVTLLLAGVVLSAIAGSIVTLFLVLGDRLQLRLATVIGWLMGGVSIASWAHLAIVALFIAVGLVVALTLAGRLDALALGEEVAAALGLDTERSIRAGLVASALLTAAAVSIAGLVAFVGLVAPHAVRLVLGPRHARLLPAAALAGALFVVVADLVARVALAPAELPVGVVSGLVGGPFFLALLWRQRAVYRL